MKLKIVWIYFILLLFIKYNNLNNYSSALIYWKSGVNSFLNDRDFQELEGTWRICQVFYQYTNFYISKYEKLIKLRMKDEN